MREAALVQGKGSYDGKKPEYIRNKTLIWSRRWAN